MWLNGRTLGQHASGYTSQTYVIPPELLLPRNNVLVVKADATQPDSWWYDGGGIYRHVTLAVITTPGPFFPVNTLYSPAVVSGQISWSSGAPIAAADFLFEVTVANAADQAFENRILNVTANQPVTIGDCAKAVLRALDWDAPIVRPPDSFQGAGYKSLDSTVFMNAVDWRPAVDLEQGVRMVLATDFRKEPGR